MSVFIFTIVGLYSDDSSGPMPAVRRMSSTMRLLASRAIESQSMQAMCNEIAVTYLESAKVLKAATQTEWF